MSYTYTPTYYSTLHDSITSICKNILPFPFKKRRLPAIAAAEQLRAKQQSDNLKWQQESFHQIHNLMGLCKEGILHEDEVSAFRAHLLETLIASPVDYEPPAILKDKLIFLQELFYAKCISEDEYHASKRPLLQRLAVQGAEIGERDVIVAGPQKKISNEGWSVIDLKEEKCLVNSENLKKQEDDSMSKKIKGTSSVLAFVSPNRYGKLKEDKDASDPGNRNMRPKDRNVCNELLSSTENPFWNGHLNEKESKSMSILMMESLPEAPVAPEKQSGSKKGDRKPFRTLFQQEQKEENDDQFLDNKEKGKSAKKAWGFDGFKKWKKNRSQDETAPLSLSEKSDDASYTGPIVAKTNGEQFDAKKMKKKLHPNGSPAEVFLDEAFAEDVKKELFRTQTELSSRSPRDHLSDDQIEEISTRNPVDNAELKFFSKSRCGDAALHLVRKEFKDQMREREVSPAMEKQNSKRWATFDDEENSHPNLFTPQEKSYSVKQARFSSSRTSRASFNSSSIDKGFKYNPFFDM